MHMNHQKDMFPNINFYMVFIALIDLNNCKEPKKTKTKEKKGKKEKAHIQ